MGMRGVRDWGFGIRIRGRECACRCARTPTPNPQPLTPRRTRRAISLMEVLISMFILAVGLLGVAALIPAGRHEIVQAAKLDNASMVGRAAFRDLQVRGFLNPANWVAFPGTWNTVYAPTSPQEPFTNYDPSATGGGPDDVHYIAYALDPLGLTAPAGAFDTAFPHAAPLSMGMRVPPMMRIAPFGFAGGITANQQLAAFDAIFRSSFDHVLEPNTNADFPPAPKWFQAGGDARRMNEGNYSWMATIVSDPTRLGTSGDVTVSVAVFYKRDLSNPALNEASSAVTFPVNTPITSGSTIEINTLPTDLSGKPRPLKPGQWIMLGGRRTNTSGVGPPQFNYYRWYKVLAAATPVPNGGDFKQTITIAGSDWNATQNNTEAWIFENIVNVYEKQLPLEIP